MDEINDDGVVVVDALVHGKNGSGTSTMVTFHRSDSKYNKETKRILERILINAGDSTTRYCSENAIKLAKISCILLTSLGVQNTSGLAGILLSLSALGVGKVIIIGPAGLAGLLQSMLPFTNRNYPELDVKEIGTSQDPDLQQPIVTPLQHFSVLVYPMTIASPIQESKAQKDENSSSSSHFQVCHVFTLSFVLHTRTRHSTLTDVTVECDDIDEEEDSSHSTNISLGILSTSQKLNLKPSVKDMINTFKAQGANTMISFPMDINCSLWGSENSSHIASICKDSKMRCIINNNIWDGQMIEFRYPQISLCLLQCLCSSLFPAPLHAAIDHCGESINECISSSLNNLYIAEGSVLDIGSCEHFQITRSGACFHSDEPVPIIDSMKEKLHELIEGASRVLNIPTLVFLSFIRRLSKSSKHFSPHTNFTAADRIRNGLKRRKFSNEQVDIEIQLKRGLLEDSLKLPPPNPYDVKITFLGTGSAAPSKHRNSSAVFIQVPCADLSVGYTSVLLDAGEGCAAQLSMLCGGDQSRYEKTLLEISVIWISHHHADHHCGLPRLIQQIQHARSRTSQGNGQITDSTKVPFPKLVVIGSEDVIKYQEYCACVAGLEEICEYVDIKTTSQRASGNFFPKNSWEEIRQHSLRKVREASRGHVTSLSSVAVHHCKNSFGLVLHLQRYNPEQIVRIVYSGDCRPSESLQLAGCNCDLLIHEATFDDSMSMDACKKKHCTTSEAMAVAKNMMAKHTILTHFSQRYVQGTVQTKIEKDVNGDDSYEDSKFSVAFDFLQMHFPSQIAYLPRITEGIVRCFERSSVDMSDTLPSTFSSYKR